MKKPILILWLGLVAPALFGQNNFLDLQSNGIPASKITGTISTNVLPMSQIVSAGTPGLNGSNGTNGSQGIQGNPGVNGTNNAVTVTNFITLYETNIYVTFFTNSTLVLQTNATTVLQTNAVTINSTNAVTTQLDSCGNEIQRFDSIIGAAKSIGSLGSKFNIGAVCRGERQKAKGYGWKYG